MHNSEFNELCTKAHTNIEHFPCLCEQTLDDVLYKLSLQREYHRLKGVEGERLKSLEDSSIYIRHN